jgi:hypothetical protein
MIFNHLMTLIFWGVTLWQIPRTDMRNSRTRLGFMTLAGITLLSTIRNPVIALAVDNFFHAPDLGHLLEYCLAIVAAFSWALVCMILAQTSVGRRRWLLYLTPVIVGGLIAVWYFSLQAQATVQEYFYGVRSNYSLALTVLGHTYVVIILTGIGIPATRYYRQQLTNAVLRLRFLMIIVLQILIVVLSGSVILVHGLMMFDVLPRTYQSPLILWLILLMSLAWIISLFPAKVYAFLILTLEYLEQMRQLSIIQRLEKHIASLLALSPHPVSLYEAIFAPGFARLHLVVAIIDLHKSLQASDHTPAQEMAQRLDEIIVKFGGQYEELAQELCVLASKI